MHMRHLMKNEVDIHAATNTSQKFHVLQNMTCVVTNHDIMVHVHMQLTSYGLTDISRRAHLLSDHTSQCTNHRVGGRLLPLKHTRHFAVQSTTEKQGSKSLETFRPQAVNLFCIASMPSYVEPCSNGSSPGTE